MRRLHRDPNLSSLRMGITQYDEVPAEYVSLLVENYTNAVWISWQQRPPIFEMSACGHLPNCSSLIALILGSSYADFHCRISARRSQRKRALVFVVVTSRTSSFGRFRGLEPLSGFWGCCLSATAHRCGEERFRRAGVRERVAAPPRLPRGYSVGAHVWTPPQPPRGRSAERVGAPRLLDDRGDDERTRRVSAWPRLPRG